MPDFAALPPEINSGRMYLGPGSGPLLGAAAAWSAVTAELSRQGAGYGLVVSELAGQSWLGPASLVMVKAAAVHIEWLHRTADEAARTAAQASAAAAAHDTAFAMTVPPAVVAANRSLLMTLIAANFLGQNTPAIAATEALYAEMWVQDAVAMYEYLASSITATRLTPFTPAPPVSNAQLAQPASTPMSQAADPLTTAATAAIALIEHVPNVTNSVLSTSNAVTSGRGIIAINERLVFQAERDEEQYGFHFEPWSSGAPVPTVSAGPGRGTLVGKLSVPAAWVTAAPEIRPTAVATPVAGASTTPGAAPVPSAGAGNMFSQSLLGTLSRHSAPAPRHKSKPIIVRSPAAG